MKYLYFKIFKEVMPRKHTSFEENKKVKLLIFYIYLALNNKNIFPLGVQHPAIPGNRALKHHLPLQPFTF